MADLHSTTDRHKDIKTEVHQEVASTTTTAATTAVVADTTKETAADSRKTPMGQAETDKDLRTGEGELRRCSKLINCKIKV